MVYGCICRVGSVPSLHGVWYLEVQLLLAMAEEDEYYMYTHSRLGVVVTP